MTSHRKDVNKRCLKKMDDDLQKIVTPSDISKFSTSQIARDALKVLGAASQGQDISISRFEYTVVRDYLMSETILRNANRPGVLATMQVKHVKEARLIEDHYIISISSHKTSGVHGPAKIIVTKMLYSWLTIFTDKILPQTPVQSDLVFQSWNGEAVDVGRCFQMTLKKAGLRDGITCTLFRKSAVSKIHQECPAEKANLADLMSHRPETATRWYRVVDKEQTCVRASAMLTKVMDINCTDDISPSAASTGRPTSVTDTYPSTATEDTDVVKNVRRTKMFTEREIGTITKCCRSIIEGGKITPDRIKAALSGTEEGTKQLKRYTVTQLVTRLTYERRKLAS